MCHSSCGLIAWLGFITFRFILFSRCWVRRGEIMLWCRGINPQTFNYFISSPVSSRGLRRHLLWRLLCGRMLSSSHSIGLLFGRALAACPASLFICSSPSHVALCTSESVESLISLPSVHLFIISPFTVIQTIPPRVHAVIRHCVHTVWRNLITLLLLSCWLILPEIISLLAFWV